MAAPAAKCRVQGFDPPWFQCFLCPVLVLDVEPNPQSMLILRCMVFVSGQLPGGCNIVLELGETGESMLIELQLPAGDLPTGETAEQDAFWC